MLELMRENYLVVAKVGQWERLMVANLALLLVERLAQRKVVQWD